MQNQIHADPHDSSSVARILAAAEALFSEYGFDAVSVNAIAARAGVSKANIFHHFTCKNELYLAVIKDACKGAQSRVEMVEKNYSSFAERLIHFARTQLQFMLEHGQTTRLIMRELLENKPERGRELAEEVFGPNFAKLVAMIREGQLQGKLRTELDPAAIAVMLFAMNVYFFEARDVMRHYPDVDFADDPQSYSNKMMQTMLLGVLPDDRKQFP